MANDNGISLTRAYHDASYSLDYDRRELNDFFEMIDSECAQVVVVRSLNEITDNVSDLEKFDTCSKGSCGLLHSNRPGSGNYFTR
jgi:DNA invertase Pin-like site-specific DNA recombinase